MIISFIAVVGEGQIKGEAEVFIQSQLKTRASTNCPFVILESGLDSGNSGVQLILSNCC